MKRYLLTQMRNEWKGNFWLCLELIIVSVAVWVLTLMMCAPMTGLFEPCGFEYDNVYVADLKRVSEESPEFAMPSDTSAQGRLRAAGNEIRLLMQRIGDYDWVEAVGVGNNALPYNYNYSGNNFYALGSRGDTLHFNGNMRIVTPGMAEVLRYQSLTGQTPAQMRALLGKGEILLAAVPDEDSSYPAPGELRGLMLRNDAGSGEWKVGSVINVVRRTDYEPAYSGTFIIPIDPDNDRNMYYYASNIAIRVKPGNGGKIMEELRSNPEFSRQGNTLVRNFRSLEEVRRLCQWSVDIQLRQCGAGILCLFVIVFLGLLGTFWFRVQQRVGEIAIRKVAGATEGDIFRRMISESLFLVAVATLVAWPVCWALLHFDVVVVSRGNAWLPVWCALAVLVMLVVAVLGGIYFPARRAMKIEPAVALKSE